MNRVNETNNFIIFLRVQPLKRPLRLNIMAFCPEHPKRDQNLKFTPLSETTRIPAPFIWESSPPPPPGDECSHSESHCDCSARREKGPREKMKNKERVCTKCFEKEILQMLNCVPGVHMNKPTKWLLSSQRIKSSFHQGT